MTLSKQKSLKAVHFQIENTTAVLYLVKIGGTGNQMLQKLSKEIWQYLLKHQITVTAEYLPSSLNVEADWQSRNSSDPSGWKLCPKVFQVSLPEERNVQNRLVCIKAISPTTPVLCLETRSFQPGNRCPTADLGQSIPLCISPILPYSTSLEKSELPPSRKTVACHTNLAVSDLVPPTTRNVYSSSTAASKEHKPNKPIRESSPFNCKQDITTSGVDHIRENYLVREFQKQLPNLLQVQDEKI